MKQRKRRGIVIPVLALILAAGAAFEAGAQQAPGASPAAAQAGIGPVTLANLVPRYFDLLDFMRTKVLGRSFSTPAGERSRVTSLVGANWALLDRGTQASLIAMAEMGGSVASDFASRSETDRKSLIDEWRRTVLSPLMLYPPPAASRNYSRYGLSFSYPSSWGLAEGQSYLFLAPDLNTSWEAVGSAFSAPPGILIAAFADDSGGAPYLDVARRAATNYVPGLGELCAFGSGEGAIVVLNGRFPGQAEEKFFWLVLLPAGGNLVLARMGGPVAQVDSLIPAFFAVLNSLRFSQGQGGYQPGSASSAFDTAWSRVSSAIVTNIWAK
jgi:hypothetical protein